MKITDDHFQLELLNMGHTIETDDDDNSYFYVTIKIAPAYGEALAFDALRAEPQDRLYRQDDTRNPLHRDTLRKVLLKSLEAQLDLHPEPDPHFRQQSVRTMRPAATRNLHSIDEEFLIRPEDIAEIAQAWSAALETVDRWIELAYSDPAAARLAAGRRGLDIDIPPDMKNAPSG